MNLKPIVTAVVTSALCACAGNVKSPRGGSDAAVIGSEGDGAVSGTDGGVTVDGAGPGPLPPLPPEEMVITAPEVDDHGLPSAPAFSEPIRYLSKPGSATLYLPAVPGVGDYRVFALTDGVRVALESDGSERVDGATIACAGLVQHNQCDPSEATMQYGPNFGIPSCSADLRAASVPKSVLRQVGLDGLSGKTVVVVEAIDALCPFPGAYGVRSHEIACSYDGEPTATATYQGRTVTWPLGPDTMPVRTEAEIRAQYGSLILNGQGPAPTVVGESPFSKIGLPAPSRHPKVLARAVINVEPLEATRLPPGFDADDFYESFSDPSDQPRATNDREIAYRTIPVQEPVRFETSKLNLYSFAADDPQWFVAQGTLRSVLSDIGQGIMGSNIAYPKRAFQLPTSDQAYVHATFEVPTDASQRRYWWFHACGAATAGQTVVNGKLAPNSAIVAQPGFMNPIEGAAVSSRGWNCLQIVPRGGSYEVMPGGQRKPQGLPDGRPESDLRVVINRALENPQQPDDLAGSVVNVSPAQEENVDPQLDGAWMRQWDRNKRITGVMLDDQLFVEQRVTFDVYFNRGRIVLFANGVQKLCNDFPRQRLTMAEAAIGIGHVFYHSSVEREEFLREDWIRTGQYQYLHNTPFIDLRNFDNFGVREEASLPANFEVGQCFSSPN